MQDQEREAVGKRQEIKEINKQALMIICLAAAAMGIVVVGGIFMVQTIMFNSTVLQAQDESIQIFRDNTVAIRTLNDRVLELGENENLEAVAMRRSEACLTADGQLQDFEENVDMMRVCSALRALPDAMPWRANASALGASMSELLRFPGISVDQTSVSTGTGMSAIGAGTLDLNFNVRGNVDRIGGLINQIERSIRPIVFNTANFEWRMGEELAMSATASAHFAGEASADRRMMIVRRESR